MPKKPPLRAFTTICLAGSLLAAVAEAQSHSPYDVLTYRLAVTIAFEESPGPESPWRPYFSVLNRLEAGIRDGILAKLRDGR